LVDIVFVAPGNGGTEGGNIENLPLKDTQHDELVEFAADVRYYS
jgi:hypothetical protein